MNSETHNMDPYHMFFDMYSLAVTKINHEKHPVY